MNNIFKIFNKRVFLYAILIWLNLNISGIQNIYFSGEITATTIVIKALHIIFLYVILEKIHSLYIKRKIPKVKNEIIISSIYFFILIILLFLVWPGAWSNDDITILRNAEKYDLTPWHHFFSGLFHTLCLQTIPIPSGVIIIQILIASLIVGYCVSNISELYGKNRKQARIIQIVLGLITLLPPLILYILSGFRMGMYSYLELLLITKMIILYKEKKQLDFSELLKISFLTIIISCWRTEGIYYPFFILTLYFILGKKVISKKVAIISCSIIIVINFSIGKINNLMIGTNNYSITATIEGVMSLVRNSDETDKDELEAINKVMDVEYIKENPSFPSERIYWTKDVVKDYTDEEYSNYIKSYIKLALKYPDVLFKSMWKMFLKSGSGFGENFKQTTYNMVLNAHSNALELFKINTQGWREWTAVTSRVAKYNTPINTQLRNNVILFFNGSDVNRNLTIIHNIFWNLFIPFTLILICLIYKLIKKDWFIVLLILAIVARIPLVFLTAPAPYFMYYLSAYLCTYVVSAIVILEFNRNLIDKKSIDNKNEANKELVVYKESKKEKAKKLFKQFLSFLLVSGVGWIIDFSIYFVLTHFANFNVGFANIFSSIPAITYVFLMSNKRIFKNINSKLSLKIKYLIYFGYQLILLLGISLLGEFLYNKLVNFITVEFLLNNLKIVIKILITPITMTLNFIFMKNLIEKL